MRVYHTNMYVHIFTCHIHTHIHITCAYTCTCTYAYTHTHTGRLDRLLVREVVGELLEGRLGELGLTVPQTCVSAMCVFSKSLHACVCSRVFAM